MSAQGQEVLGAHAASLSGEIKCLDVKNAFMAGMLLFLTDSSEAADLGDL